MGSALAFWAFQRNLGQQNDDQAIRQEEQAENNDKVYSRSKRNDSESSTQSWQTDPAARRDSLGDPTTDDEALEHPRNRKDSKSKTRRFSLDFLFARKQKDSKKPKSNRSQSVAVGNDASILPESRLGPHQQHNGSEFALAM